MTMNDIRSPAQFLHSLQNATCEEDHTFIIIGKELFVFIMERELPMEIIFIVNKIDLHASLLNGSDLNDQGVVSVIDNQVHSRKPDHFVQLVTTFVDVSKTRHKRANFSTSFLDALRKMPSYQAHGCLLQIRCDFLCNEQYFWFLHNISKISS